MAKVVPFYRYDACCEAELLRLGKYSSRTMYIIDKGSFTSSNFTLFITTIIHNTHILSLDAFNSFYSDKEPSTPLVHSQVQHSAPLRYQSTIKLRLFEFRIQLASHPGES